MNYFLPFLAPINLWANFCQFTFTTHYNVVLLRVAAAMYILLYIQHSPTKNKSIAHFVF